MKQDLLDRLKAALTGPGKEREMPIPCGGYSTDTDWGREYDCSYVHAGEFDCEGCICSGGDYDPRTGKRFAKRKVKQSCVRKSSK